MPPKVLHVIATMNPELGGVAKAVSLFSEGLASQEIVNDIATLDPPGASYFANPSGKTYNLGPATKIWHYSSKLRPFLTENFKNYDAVIAHGLWLHVTTATAAAAKSRQNVGDKTQFFVMPHGMLDPWFQKAPSRRLKAIRNLAYWHLLEKKNLASVDGLLFTCEKERELAKTTFSGYPDCAEHVVGLGVPSPPFPTSTGNELGDYLLFLGRLDQKKNLHGLIRAYVKLATKSATAVPGLVIAGPVNSPYADEAISMAKESGLPTYLPGEVTHRVENGWISFEGMVSGDVKWNLLRNASAFVLASYQENFGIAVAEALACGTPVLISDQVNICTEIEKERAGIVFEQSDSALTNALNQWLDNVHSGATKGFRQRALECFSNHFEIDKVATRLAAVVSN